MTHWMVAASNLPSMHSTGSAAIRTTFQLALLIALGGGAATLALGAVGERGADATASPAPATAGDPSPCVPGPVTSGDFAGSIDVPRFEWPTGGEYHEFFFVRAIYSDAWGFGRGRGRGSTLGDRGPAWSTDYARADRHMVLVTKRLSNIDACEWEHPISLADPDLRRYPFVYTLEWGQAQLSEVEVRGLRDYLEAGGLLMIDDFWGTYERANFERQMERVLPGRRIVEIPREHLLFHVHYSIEGEILQVPNVSRGHAIAQGAPPEVAAERDGYVPQLLGIFDDDGHLMVVINWNTDLGDALEWAESPYYPLKYSSFASEVFLNTIMYSMTR